MARARLTAPGVTLHSVDAGGARRSAQVIQCAFCEEGSQHIWIKKTPLPDVAVMRFGRDKGWDMDKRRGRHKCPACKERERMAIWGMKQARPSQTPPRQMDAGDRRRVFRAVDEAYDDVNGRYVGGVSDATIAADLGIPRKWVETIREENFGPSGTDPEVDRICAEIARVEAEVKTAMDDCLAILGRAEKTLNELKARTAVLSGKRMK